MTKSNLSNPFSTGGGGTTFEQLVGATYLVSLLAGDIPRGLDGGVIKEVKFQHRWAGCLLDDIVVSSTDGKTERNLALQVKHKLTFSGSNKIFARVLKDCWETFQSSLGWQFNQNTDRIGIAIGNFSNKLNAQFRPLLEWARTSVNSNDFFTKVSIPLYSSAKKRNCIEIIQKLLSKFKGSKVTKDELWRFLKCLVIIHFDFEYAASRDSINSWNRLRDLLKSRDEGQARLLFGELTSVVAEYSRTSGNIDYKTIRSKIPGSISLRESKDCISDLNQLKNHSNRVLRSIRDTIGDKFHLPRPDLLNEIETLIKEKDIVVITGEAMVGKSVLLKLLANRFRAEGEVIALSVDRFSGRTIEEFLHNINIENDFQDILAAAGTAPLRSILIDGLEGGDDEDRRRIINDFILEVRKHNETVISNGGCKENCWKIVFTCRDWQYKDILSNLETRKNIDDKTLGIFKVDPFNENEINEVTAQIPSLKSLTAKNHLTPILSRPLILDILTIHDISSLGTSKDSPLTESWLAEQYWKEVVRLSGNYRKGKGLPEKRENLLFYISLNSLKGSKYIPLNANMDPVAVSGLVSDRILTSEDNKLWFAHDTYHDWALSILIKNNKDRITEFLIEHEESLRLVTAFRLFVSRVLEVENNPLLWINLLENLEKEKRLSPRWHQIALSTPLFSSQLKNILNGIKPHLFGNNGALLNKLLNTLRLYCVVPGPLVYALFAKAPENIKEKYLSYSSEPIIDIWLPVLELILENFDKLVEHCLYEFSYIAEKWMTKGWEEEIYKKEIIERIFALRNSKTQKRKVTTLSYDQLKEMKKNFEKSILWAADILPEEIEDFVRKNLNDSKGNRNDEFEEFILEEGWIPIAKDLPKLTVDIMKKILCITENFHDPMDYYNVNNVFLNKLGIRETRWKPPTDMKGPFHGLLRLHSDDGLNLIHALVNHATQCWKRKMKVLSKQTPARHNVKLKNADIDIYGDHGVYCWYRYPSGAPDVIICALMALEYWMNKQLQNEVNPVDLFEKVLKGTTSAAVIGVCVSVALENFQVCLEAVLPIIENPIFWWMDISRLSHDMHAESSIAMLSSLSLRTNRKDFENLIELAKKPHRSLDLRSFVFTIVMEGPQKICDRLQKAVRAFPKNLFFFFEEEKKDEKVIENRLKTCKIWAAMAEKDNYSSTSTTNKDEVVISFKLPDELENILEDKKVFREEPMKLLSFETWAINFLDQGKIGEGFTLQSAMEYSIEKLKQIDLTKKFTTPVEDSEPQINAITVFVSALVIHKLEWVEKNNHISWCKEQLLTVANRPESDSVLYNTLSIRPNECIRSAARSLPVLFQRFPNDKDILRAIFKLASCKDNLIREFLFASLDLLWEKNEKIIWTLINKVVKQSRINMVYRKFSYLDMEPHFYRLEKIYITPEINSPS